MEVRDEISHCREKQRNITRQSFLFQFTDRSLYLSVDDSGKNRKLHSKNKPTDNTLDDPWKTDQKFHSYIVQSHGIGQKPETPLRPKLKEVAYIKQKIKRRSL